MKKIFFAISNILITFAVVKQAEVAQLAEHQLPKLRVASSNLVFRSEKDSVYKPSEKQKSPVLRKN